MNIFSEIYGAYFRIAKKAMEKENISEKEIYNLIKQYGFEDSSLFLSQKLIPQNDNTDWGFFKKNPDGNLRRVIKNNPPSVLTKTQKMWLKAKLNDPKIHLFLESEVIDELNEKLSDTAPLYENQHFRYTDKFSDGDCFADDAYCRYFRMILDAIKKRQVLNISFKSGHDRRIRGNYLPVKIQYSEKNDKFRLLCYSIKEGEISGSGIINMGRILSVFKTDILWESDISDKDFFEKRICKTPVTIKITTERNAVERFMAEFASYEKRTERDLETGKCTVSLWYDKQDETELLIRLLGFGPVLEIMGPPDFRKQAAQRVKKQAELLAE